MTGLEKIIAQIKDDSDRVCADTNSKTEAQCKAIICKAAEKADVITAQGKQDAQAVYDDILLRAKSSAELEARSIILKAKQDIISSSLDKARSSICDLPADEYFELLYKMIAKYSEEADGLICLSKKDTDRLPADFSEKLNEVAKGKLSVDSKPADIDGGFILIYGGIEVNCSFLSLFSAQSEIFSDEVSKLLFA